MSLIYSEEEVIAAVPGLDRVMLMRFVETRIVIPIQRDETPPAFNQTDAARLRLACELCDSLDLEDDALAIVMGLIDRLHSVRADLRAVLEVVETLPEAERRQVTDALAQRGPSDAE
ncbi:MAG: hypothetical protein AAGF94_16015 [Pseudomonadota bacterium]